MVTGEGEVKTARHQRSPQGVRIYACRVDRTVLEDRTGCKETAAHRGAYAFAHVPGRQTRGIPGQEYAARAG